MLYYFLFLALSLIVLTLVADNYLLPLLGQWSQSLAKAYPGIVPAKFGEWMGKDGMLSIFPVIETGKDNAGDFVFIVHSDKL